MSEPVTHRPYRIPRHEKLSLARGLMEEFANATGILEESVEPRRYLWTDAFAVCNFVTLYRITEQNRFLETALRLITQVHETLGRHRADDIRRGWISGLNEHQGRRHPTRGGLRIGKTLKERHPTEPFDEHLEWSRDGQYFHYLTKWAHALVVVGNETGDETFLVQADELMRGVLPHFLYVPRGSMHRRIYWKMSIDLTRPLIPSMGHLDPLDGLVLLHELHWVQSQKRDRLQDECEHLSEICGRSQWRTTDMLSLGSLMIEAYRMGQLLLRGEDIELALVYDVINGAYEGLVELEEVDWTTPPELRLAFRELGLVIGLKAIGRFSELMLRDSGLRDILGKKLVAFERFLPLIGVLESYWSAPEKRMNGTWTEHADINEVMLATALLPHAFLELDSDES